MRDNDVVVDQAVERRGSKRFPIEQEVSYKVLDHKAIVPESGLGRTFDMSSGGILFATEQRLRSGKRVEVAVQWPATLESGCRLKFVAVGRVVRVEDARAAMSIEQYEFRTRSAKDAAPAGADKPPRAAVPYH